MEKKCRQIGVINNNGFESANRVYRGGCCPTLKSRDYKDSIKVIKTWKRKHTTQCQTELAEL